MISGPMEKGNPNPTGVLYKDTHFGYYSLGIGSVMWAQPFGTAALPTAGGFSGYPIGYGCSGERWKYQEGDYGTSAAPGATYCAKFHLPENLDQVEEKSAHVDSMMAVLGWNWHILRPGDTVTVIVVHTPTGKTIWQKDVIVEG